METINTKVPGEVGTLPAQKEKKAKLEKPKMNTEKEIQDIKNSIASLVEIVTSLASNKLDSESVGNTKELNRPNTNPTKVETSSQSNNLMFPEWRALCDEILGADFGLEFKMPKNGPMLIKVSIPEAISNAGQAHWEFYANDVRTWVIDQNQGSEGVKNFFKKIAANLNLLSKEEKAKVMREMAIKP